MPFIIDFGSWQGKPGKLLRSILKLTPRNIVLPILQGTARGKLWNRASGVDGYWLGSYEKPKQELFASLIKDGDVVYDIGANAGFYTLVGAASAKNVKVFSFEPEELNYEFLCEHIRRNNIDAAPMKIAIAAENGFTGFHLGENASSHKLESSGELQVPCRTIDSLLAEGLIEPPQIIKIDVEGAEEKVLSGARNTLKKYGPHILVETSAGSPAIRLLEELGYAPECIGKGEFFARSPSF